MVLCGEKWGKVLKTPKSGEEWEKVDTSREKLLKVMKSGEKWIKVGKVVKSSEK